MREGEIERDAEPLAALLEVLVELPADGVESGRRVDHPGRDPFRELVVEVLVTEADAHQALRRGREGERSDRTVERCNGDVDEGSGPLDGSRGCLGRGVVDRCASGPRAARW